MKRRNKGLTFVELLTSLTIMSVCAVAGERLLAGALSLDTYMQTANTAVSELDMSARRIVHNVRSCAALPTITSTSIALKTQPDPNYHSGSQANVSYTYSSSAHTLTETDDRYGTDVIAHHVTSFSVAQTSSGAYTTVFQITIGVGIPVTVTTPTFSRTFRVCCRNF